MRLALMAEGQEGVTWDEWVALARACEEHGVDALFRSDHYTAVGASAAGSLDAWGTLAALAAVTSRLRLGTLVSPVTFRHPSLLGRMVTTVDHVSGGRVELGLGTGWYEREHVQAGFSFPPLPVRFDLLEEQLQVLVGTWTGEDFSFEGEHYVLRDQVALPAPVQRPHPPVILAGSAKPRSARLAAWFAQEYNTLAVLETQVYSERRAALDAACRDIGRDPATLPLSVMVLCAVGETPGDVEDRLRVATEMSGVPEPEPRWLVGSPEQIVERLGDYARHGVSRVFLKNADHRDLDAVALIGKIAAAAAAL
jgi:F420-dependent oxidoreductase-like protein